MFKKPVRQGRSERSGEAYIEPYVEPLSDARTRLAGFFNILLHRDGNHVDDIEDDALGLFEAMGAHPVSAIQHHTVG